MKKFFISYLLFFLSTATVIAQYDTLDFHCSYTPEDSVITDDLGIPPLMDTTNLAILLCVEKE